MSIRMAARTIHGRWPVDRADFFHVGVDDYGFDHSQFELPLHAPLREPSYRGLFRQSFFMDEYPSERPL